MSFSQCNPQINIPQDVTQGHTIVPNGYNIGDQFYERSVCRFWSKGWLINQGRDRLASSAIGQKSFGGVTYTTTARNMTGLLAPGSTG